MAQQMRLCQDISAQFLHEWLDFPGKVSTLCNSLDLDARVSATYDSDENEHFQPPSCWCRHEYVLFTSAALLCY